MSPVPQTGRLVRGERARDVTGNGETAMMCGPYIRFPEVLESTRDKGRSLFNARSILRTSILLQTPPPFRARARARALSL
jgi:hypothetical protein